MPSAFMDSGPHQAVKRGVARLLDAAVDYCVADDRARRASAEWATLVAHHSNRNGVVCSANGGDPFSEDEDSDDTATPALPRSEWCDYCREYQRTGTDGFGAGGVRRSARQRMRRAYREIVALRPALPDAINTLYANGDIRHRFTAAEIESLVRGVFSAKEIRHWLSSHDHSQFRRVAKYTYEIVAQGTDEHGA